MLPTISGEFGVVAAPELRFNDNGNPWLKVRGVAKDRRKNQKGEWEDREPCFIDIIVSGKQAENLAESITIGDAILVNGELTMREYETDDGRRQKAYSIRARNCGVSVQFTPARPPSLEHAMASASSSVESEITPW